MVWPLPADPALHIPYMSRCDIFPDDLAAQVHKGLVHVPAGAGRGLVVRRIVPGGGDGEGARAGDGPLVFEVALIAHDDDGHEGVILDADNLVAEFLELGQGGEGGDAEDEEEPLPGFHVQFAHGGELFRAGCVESVGAEGQMVSNVPCISGPCSCSRAEGARRGSGGGVLTFLICIACPVSNQARVSCGS